MLEPVRHILNKGFIVLASSSPRRKEILERNLGLNIQIKPSTFAEDLDKSLFKSPIDYVIENSKEKSLDVANSLKNQDDWITVVGADTVVVYDNKIYEKPKDKEDAFRMLKSLSGKTHKVFTGVSMVKKGKILNELHVKSFYEETDVNMSDMTDDVIRAYIDTGEPLDKAGSYGIQALGSSFVRSINGCYFNVMGFPVAKFSIELRNFLDI